MSVSHFSRNVLRNSLVGTLAQIAIKLLSFGFSILIVRRLGANSYGEYAGVLAFGATFVFLADLGLSPYGVREIARWRDHPSGHLFTVRFYGNLLGLRFLLSLVAATLLVLTAWLTGRPLIMVGAIALGALGLIMYSVQGASASVLAGFERLDLSARAQVLQQIAFVVVGAVALYFGRGYYGLIVANLLGIALLTFVCWRAVGRLGVRPGRPSLGAWPTLVRASIPFGIISFTLGLSYKFDSVLLNVFRGNAETGYYNAAYNLIFSAVVLSNVINTSLYPSLSRRAASGPHSLAGIYGQALRYMMALAFPIAVGTWAVADRLVPFLYSQGYVPAIPALQVLTWVIPFMFASEFLGYVVVVQGQENRVARSVLVSTGLNVALNLILVPRYGLFGASAMTVITEVVLVGQYVWILRDLLRQLDWPAIVLRPLTAALIMGGVLMILRDLPLPLTVLVGGLTYGGLGLALGVLGKAELDLLRSMRRKTATAATTTSSAIPVPLESITARRGGSRLG